MSLDISRMVITCDSQGCSNITGVPISVRQYYDDSILELRSHSSASGWIFVSSSPRDRHYCPACASRCICPRGPALPG